MRTMLWVAGGVALTALVLIPGRGGAGLGMTLGGGAVLALFAGIAVWVRRTMSHH